MQQVNLQIRVPKTEKMEREWIIALKKAPEDNALANAWHDAEAWE